MCTMIPREYITSAGSGLLMVHALLLPLPQWLWLVAQSSLLIDYGSGTGAPPNRLSQFSTTEVSTANGHPRSSVHCPCWLGALHNVSEVGDPLDDTQVHPEDYELSCKMVTDALELNEEDIHDDHPSHVISVIMQDKDKVSKLDELNLDDFTVTMYKSNNDLKWHALNVIKDELLWPFREVQNFHHLGMSSLCLPGRQSKHFALG